MRTLIVGVGSGIRGDDGIGPEVAFRLAAELGGETESTAFDGTGLDLLSYFTDSNAFDRVVVIDSLDTCALEEGVVARVAPRPEAAGEANYASSHHVGILEAFALARRFGVRVPPDLRLYAIGILPSEGFREGLGEPLARRVPAIVREIRDDLVDASRGAFP